jgi:16S rRNA (cytosine1407-C5)-methyltransferase
MIVQNDEPDNLERYCVLLSEAEAAQLVQAVQRPLLSAIRVNTLKVDVEQARGQWSEQYGWQTRPVPFCASGWQIVAQARSPGRTLEHRMGLYYVQNAASMLPVEMFRFDQARPLVLDMAASPGGKTTHLTCNSRDGGLVIANDVSARRIPALRSNLQDWGVMGAAVTNYPGGRFGAWFPGVFDKVLLDAPCSGESLRAAEWRKSRTVSATERQALHRRQINLLTSALQALRPGGEAIYATCTLAPEEDEAVLDAVLNSYHPQITVESVDHVLPRPAPGLASDGEREFHPQVRRAARLWPQLYDTSGFFAALIRKHDTIPVQPHSPPARPLAQAGLEAMGRRERDQVVEQLLQAFGFDLGVVLERQALALWQRERSIYAVPELFLSRFADLPCAALGMLVGTQSPKGFVLSHELAARFGPQFAGGRMALSDEQVEVWLAGRDLRGVDAPYPVGAVVLVEDGKGRFVGRGKVLGKRIRNLLPRRWVY